MPPPGLKIHLLLTLIANPNIGIAVQEEGEKMVRTPGDLEGEENGSSEVATVKLKDPDHGMQNGSSKTSNSKPKNGPSSTAPFNRQISGKPITESEGEDGKSPDNFKSTGPLRRKKKKASPKKKHTKSQHSSSPYMSHTQPHCKSHYSLKRREKSSHGSRRSIEQENEAVRRCKSLAKQSPTPQQLEVDTPASSDISSANVPNQARAVSERAPTTCTKTGKGAILPTNEPGRGVFMHEPKYPCAYLGPIREIVRDDTKADGYPECTSIRDNSQQHKASTQEMKSQCNIQTEVGHESFISTREVEPPNSQSVVCMRQAAEGGRMNEWKPRSTKENRWDTSMCVPEKLRDGMTESCKDRKECHALPSVLASLRPPGTLKAVSFEMDPTVETQPAPQPQKARVKSSSSSPEEVLDAKSSISTVPSVPQDFLSVFPTPHDTPTCTLNLGSPQEVTGKGITPQLVSSNHPKCVWAEAAHSNEDQCQPRMRGHIASNKQSDMAHRCNTQATYKEAKSTSSRLLCRGKKRKNRRMTWRQRRQTRLAVNQNVNLGALQNPSAHPHRNHLSGSHELVGDVGLSPSVELSAPTLLPQPSNNNCAVASEMVVDPQHTAVHLPLASERCVLGTTLLSRRCNVVNHPEMVCGVTQQPCPGNNTVHASFPVQEQAPVMESLAGQYTCTCQSSRPTQEACAHSDLEQRWRQRTCPVHCTVQRLDASTPCLSCLVQVSGVTHCTLRRGVRASSFPIPETTGLQVNSRARFVFLSPHSGGLAPAVHQCVPGLTTRVHHHFCVQQPNECILEPGEEVLPPVECSDTSDKDDVQ